MVERCQTTGIGGEDPASARHDGTDRDQELWSEAIDEVGLKWGEEGLQHDQQRKRYLDFSQRGAKFLVQGTGKQRPDILGA